MIFKKGFPRWITGNTSTGNRDMVKEKVYSRSQLGNN